MRRRSLIEKIDGKVYNYASLEGVKDGTHHVDAVMIGDSWVDCAWCGFNTWPMLLALKSNWTSLNVGKCGTVVADTIEQLETVITQLDELGGETDENTLWIVHSGGNDVLFGLLPFYVQMTLDVIRMHIILSIGGNAALQKWLLFAGEDSCAWFTYFPRGGDKVAVDITAFLETLKARCNAKRFLVASNTISSAMPLCRTMSSIVTPVYGLRILDMIALIISSRLTAKLAKFENDNGTDVKVYFFDEGEVCVDRRLDIKWRHDKFHPLEDGYDILAQSCQEVLQSHEPVKEYAARKEAELRKACISHESTWAMFELFSSVFVTTIVGIPLCLMVTVVNGVYHTLSLFASKKDVYKERDIIEVTET